MKRMTGSRHRVLDGAYHTPQPQTGSGQRPAKAFVIGTVFHGRSTHVKCFLCVWKKQCGARKTQTQARTGAKRYCNGYCSVGSEERFECLRPTLLRPPGETSDPLPKPPPSLDPRGGVCAHFRGGDCTILYLRAISTPIVKCTKIDRTEISMRACVFVQTVALMLHLTLHPQHTPPSQRAPSTVWADP